MSGQTKIVEIKVPEGFPENILKVRTMSEEEFIENHGSGTLRKAKKLGAPERGINNELSVIIKKLSKEEQKKMLNVIRDKSNDQYRYLLRFVR